MPRRSSQRAHRGYSWVCFACGAILAAVLALPGRAQAHVWQLFEISGAHYLAAIGFESEPPIINERAAVELTIVTLDQRTAEMVMAQWIRGLPAGASPVPELEQTLQVEVTAKGQGSVLDFAPIFPPQKTAYRASFFPTDPGPYRFRFFGAIGGTPVDIAVECTPELSHKEIAASFPVKTVSEALSPRVTRKRTMGGFMCPRPRGPLEIPEPSYVIAARARQAAAPTPSAPAPAGGLGVTRRQVYLGLGGLAALAAVAGLAIGIRAIIRRRRSDASRLPY